MTDIKEKSVNPFIMIIFGGSGDLTLKKVIPSIYELYKRNLLPDSFFIYSLARSEFSTISYKEKVKINLEKKLREKAELITQLSKDKKKACHENHDDEGFVVKEIDHSKTEKEKSTFDTITECLLREFLPHPHTCSQHCLLSGSGRRVCDH